MRVGDNTAGLSGLEGNVAKGLDQQAKIMAIDLDDRPSEGFCDALCAPCAWRLQLRPTVPWVTDTICA
jgi:hypothetical protein